MSSGTNRSEQFFTYMQTNLQDQTTSSECKKGDKSMLIGGLEKGKKCKQMSSCDSHCLIGLQISNFPLELSLNNGKLMLVQFTFFFTFSF